MGPLNSQDAVQQYLDGSDKAKAAGGTVAPAARR